MAAERRVRELNLELPDMRTDKRLLGTYCHCVRAGDMLHLSGKGPIGDRGFNPTVNAQGKIGAGVSVEEAYGFAESCGRMLLAVMRDELGSLNKVVQVVKVFGMLNCPSGFGKHAAIVDGCSDLFLEVFGHQRGLHARTCAGVNSLPGGLLMEIECMVQVQDEELTDPGAAAEAADRAADPATGAAAGDLE